MTEILLPWVLQSKQIYWRTRRQSLLLNVFIAFNNTILEELYKCTVDKFTLYTSGKKKQCIFHIVTKIKECEGKTKLLFHLFNLTHSQNNCLKLYKSRHAYHTSDVWKCRGVNFGFTYLLEYLFFAGINLWKARVHGWLLQIMKEGFRSNVQ